VAPDDDREIGFAGSERGDPVLEGDQPGGAGRVDLPTGATQVEGVRDPPGSRPPTVADAEVGPVAVGDLIGVDGVHEVGFAHPDENSGRAACESLRVDPGVL
jgi:hypothetical protein